MYFYQSNRRIYSEFSNKKGMKYNIHLFIVVLIPSLFFTHNFRPKMPSPIKLLNNFHPATNLPKLFTNPSFSDVNFLFYEEKKQLSANKCLLAVASPVFYKMFYGDLKETGDIPIVDASYDGFKEFLQFFYFDKYELSIDHIGEVMTMADKYDVAGLTNLCDSFLEFNLKSDNENVCWIYELALLFDRNYLNRLCVAKISAETKAIFATESFKNCTKQVLTKILEMDELGCDEIDVYRSAMLWAENACQKANMKVTMESKKNELSDCFDLIRFPTMSSEEFTNCIAEDGLMDAKEFLDILSHLTLKRTLNNKRFSTAPRSGRPVWTTDASITSCDRRSLPNLNRPAKEHKDIALFSLNERILLGQIMFSSFKSEINDEKSGTLIIRKWNTSNPLDKEQLLCQTIQISHNKFSKIILIKPLVMQPFTEYEIETTFELQEDESLLFRTHCRDEIMVDGGVVFKFLRHDEVPYNNVEEGLIAKLYFKKW